MASHNLPLLHKYVFHNDDDLDLKMSKLQYRLCVQEVSHVILGRQSGLDLADIEPTIQPDFSMAATVNAQPPNRMEDFPTTDEGLSSPESEDYPQSGKQAGENQDYIYNDSGILMDESTMSNATSPSGDTTANGHELGLDEDEEDDDRLSDADSDVSDPNDYHISRQDHDPGESGGGPPEDDQDGDEAAEDTIQATLTTREAKIPIDKLPASDADADMTPPADDQPSSGLDFFTDSQQTVTEAASDNSSLPTITVQAEDDDDEVEAGDEVSEEVILRSEAKRDEAQIRLLEEERERERVDFQTGVVCEDVETALKILKTRYRLSCSTLKKCIITLPPVDARTKRYSAPIFSYERSRWNLEDMIRSPNEQMPWWSQTREPESIRVEKVDMGAMNETIDRRQGEIANLLEKVLDDEKRKRGEDQIPLVEAEVVPTQNEPGLEAIPDDAAPSTAGDGTTPGEPGKKKKGNVFQRMMRALRKRLSRNRQRA